MQTEKLGHGGSALRAEVVAFVVHSTSPSFKIKRMQGASGALGSVWLCHVAVCVVALGYSVRGLDWKMSIGRYRQHDVQLLGASTYATPARGAGCPGDRLA